MHEEDDEYFDNDRAASRRHHREKWRDEYCWNDEKLRRDAAETTRWDEDRVDPEAESDEEANAYADPQIQILF